MKQSILPVTRIGVNGLYFDHLALPLSKAAERDDLGCGQQIHIVGLFRLHFGQQRNVPIVHTGHIAALADTREKIAIQDRTTGETIQAESYLVEAQTLEGLSGSPVFVQQHVAWPAKATRDGVVSDITIAAFGAMKLLGVYQGAWDAHPGKILAADRNIKGNERIPLGMGMVVPIDRVIEIIKGNDALKKLRESDKEAKLSQRAAKMDSAFSPPSIDENPKHRAELELSDRHKG
jgi:hypothetical protein